MQQNNSNNNIDIDKSLNNINDNLDKNLKVDPYQKTTIYQKYLNEQEKKESFFKKLSSHKWLVRVSSIVLVLVIGLVVSLIVIGENGWNRSSELKDNDYFIPYSEEFTKYNKAIDSESSISPITDGDSSTTIYYSASGSTDIISGITEKLDDTSKIQVRACSLSACAYNDNDYYDFWKKLNDQSADGNIFYSLNCSYNVSTLHRIKVTFANDITVSVKLLDDNQNVVFQAMPDANGICYLFANQKQEFYDIQVEYYLNGIQQVVNYKTTGDLDLTYLKGDYLKKDLIELCLVLDATGSMSDEMDYLIAELNNVIKSVKEQNDNVLIKVSIIVYRDEGDDYVVKSNDFTDDISEACSFLGKQEASGGGDIPEAVHEAFKEVLKMKWSSDDSTKIVIHVADAESHDDKRSLTFGYIKELAAKGIQVVTLQSSSASLTSEYELRMESLLTNGYYTYLTDDSGIGNEHSTPKTEVTPVVEYANQMLIRIINGLYTGTYAEPVAYNSDKQQ